ncbi:MAG: hypothetical protein ACTHJY_19950, partial [Rhizobiaceae bacterium]
LFSSICIWCAACSGWSAMSFAFWVNRFRFEKEVHNVLGATRAGAGSGADSSSLETDAGQGSSSRETLR